MNKTILAALAVATIAGVTSMSPAAHAGSGVRLNFNGPLGSFVARPSRGGQVASSYASPKACKKNTASASRVKKDSAVAYHKPKSGSTNRDDQDNTDTAENTTETVTTGSTALIQAQTQQDASTETTKVAAADPVTPATAATQISTETSVATEAFGPPAPPAEETQPVVVEEPKSSKKSSKTAENKEDCKKFIPAVGVTISVGC